MLSHGKQSTYVADIDGLAGFSTGGSKVGEWVRGIGCSASTGIEASSSAKSARSAAAIPTTHSETSSVPTTSGKAATTEATAEAAAAEASTATETSRGRASETILTDFKIATLPLVPVELLNGIPSVVRSLKCNDARTFGTAIRSGVDICTKNTAGVRWSNLISDEHTQHFSAWPTCLAEEILQILPANVIGELPGC